MAVKLMMMMMNVDLKRSSNSQFAPFLYIQHLTRVSSFFIGIDVANVRNRNKER